MRVIGPTETTVKTVSDAIFLREISTISWDPPRLARII